MSDQSGRRVVGKREAPSCHVVFLCEECGFVCTLDAYDGPPTCFGGGEGVGGHTARFMVPRVIAEGKSAEDLPYITAEGYIDSDDRLLTREQWDEVFDVR